MDICRTVRSIISENQDIICSLRHNKILKEDGSYVSEGDLLCESLIKSFLREKLPDYYLVSEESPEENISNWQKPDVIVLDPIDGTENFVSGLMEWGVAICHYKNGIHQQSMLALPELNKYLISGDQIVKFKSRIAGISSSLTKDDLLNLASGFEYRILGCCVYNMFNVITGSFETFENPKGARVWDILPGLNLALEHGLPVTVNEREYYGELLAPDQKYRFKIG